MKSEARLNLNFLKKLIAHGSEEALLNACKDLAAGDDESALNHLRRAGTLADGAFLAGYVALKQGRLHEAEKHFRLAYEKQQELGSIFSKHKLSATFTIPITNEISVRIRPDLRGVLLALVETYQRLKKWEHALDYLGVLRRLDPDDVVIKLSMVELVMDVAANKVNICRNVVRLVGDIKNESEVHAAVLLYKGKALRKLGLLDAAKEVLTEAMGRRKDGPRNLLKAIRYERALVYEDMGWFNRARSEFKKLYEEDPAYEDVAERIKPPNEPAFYTLKNKGVSS